MERKPVSAAPIIVGILLLLGLLPALYVLSSGPVIWLAIHGYLSKEGNLYVPLQWACERCEPFDKAVTWYIGLFT